MANNKIIITPDNNNVTVSSQGKAIPVTNKVNISEDNKTITVTEDNTSIIVSSVGLQGAAGPTGPAGADGQDFPYTGSAIITGSLGVIGETNITGSVYLTNGTADDSYFPNYDGKLYHHAFYKNPSAFTINNAFHTDYTGSASTTSPLVGMLNWTDFNTTGSFTLGDPYGFYNRLRIQQDTKVANIWGIANQVLFPNEANTGTNEFDRLQTTRNLAWLENSNPTTGSILYACYNDVKVANPNSTIADIRNTFLITNLDSGTASNDVVDLYFWSDIEPPYNIEGNYYHIYAREITPPTVGGTAYNIYMPSAMDSVLGGDLTVRQGISASNAITGSDVYINDWGSVSASLATLSSSVPPTPTFQQVTDQGATTTNDVVISGSLNVTEILTAREFHTEYVSSSIIYESGSTKFGDSADDVHQFTGSLAITGSIEVSNSATFKSGIESTGSIDIKSGHVNIESNSYFLQGTSVGGSNVSLIGVDSNDNVYIGNQGYNTILQDTITTGSAIITGSLEVIGETNITGSIYLTNGTAEDSYYALRNANFYRKSFVRNPSSFTIANNQHTDFTGSVSNAPILAGTVDFTDVSVSGSTSGDVYGIFNRTRILDYSKVRTVFGMGSQVIVSGSADSQANQTKELQGLFTNMEVLGNSPTTIEDAFGAVLKVTINNGNSNVTDQVNPLNIASILTTGSAAEVCNIRIANEINSNYSISGDFANIKADSDVIQAGGNAYNIYMPAAMDSVLGGTLILQSGSITTGSAIIKGDISGSGNLTISRTDSSDTVFTLNSSKSFGRPFTITNNGLEPTINAQDVLNIQADGGNAEIKLDASGLDYISFTTNTTEAARIDNNGRLGIGTDSPAEKLTVSGSISASYQVWAEQYRFNNRASDYIYSVSDGQFGFRTVEGLSWFMSRTEFGAYRTDGPSLMRVAATSTVPTLVPNGWADENTGIGWNGADSMAFIAGGTNVMNVSGSKVGIGTDTPSYQLHNTGNSRLEGRITLGGNINNYIQADASIIEVKPNNHFQVSKGAGTGLYYSGDNDSIGIGTTTPAEKLTVSGSISASGNLYLEGTELRGDGSLNIYPATSTSNGRIQIGQSDVVFYSVPRPAIDNNTNLGSVSKRWATVYTTNLDVSGSLIAGYTGSNVHQFTGSLAIQSGSISLKDDYSNIVIGEGASAETPTQLNSTLNVVIGGNAGNPDDLSIAKTGNVVIGDSAKMPRGSSNVLVGRSVMSNSGTSLAASNVAIGAYAMQNQNGASENVAVGYTAGTVLTSGDQNVLLGFSADPAAGTDTNSIVIGHTATGKGSNTTVIGRSGATTHTYLEGLITGSSLEIGGNAYVSESLAISGSLVQHGSNYLVPSNISADAGDTVVLTGSLYDYTPMVKITHQRGSAGDVTLELPNAAASGSIYRTIRFIGDSSIDNTHRAIIAPSGSQTLDGGTSGFTMNRSYEGIMVWSDGTEWFQVQAKNV